MTAAKCLLVAQLFRRAGNMISDCYWQDRARKESTRQNLRELP